MRTRRLRSALAGTATVAAAAVLASTAFVLAQDVPRDAPAIRDAGNSAKRKPALGVRGSTSRLYPGGTARLRLKVTNRSRHPLKLRQLKVTVHDARPGCPGRLLRVKPFKTRAGVRARRSAIVKVRVTLSRDAPDACQGARFRLSYRVRATRARAKKR
jgi:hypothetical protein